MPVTVKHLAGGKMLRHATVRAKPASEAGDGPRFALGALRFGTKTWRDFGHFYVITLPKYELNLVTR